MLVVLSQRKDYSSDYADELFQSYHYPARYRHQLHTGDRFIYYQGNRYERSQRYYFGSGTVGDIRTSDGVNYYARLIDCREFEKQVPIWHPNGGYIEQLGYETVRKALMPPWQSSVRPLSLEAYQYIMKSAGKLFVPGGAAAPDIEQLKESLKTAIRDYYVGGDPSAILRIESISSSIGRAAYPSDETAPVEEEPHGAVSPLLDYCKTMRMSYSYKPVLLLALIQAGGPDGTIPIRRAAEYVRSFYDKRRSLGLPVERKKCIYQQENVTQEQIISNLITNPVRALENSGLFIYNREEGVFAVKPETWRGITKSEKDALIAICEQKIKEYYGEQ